MTETERAAKARTEYFLKRWERTLERLSRGSVSAPEQHVLLPHATPLEALQGMLPLAKDVPEVKMFVGIVRRQVEAGWGEPFPYDEEVQGRDDSGVGVEALRDICKRFSCWAEPIRQRLREVPPPAARRACEGVSRPPA